MSGWDLTALQGGIADFADLDWSAPDNEPFNNPAVASNNFLLVDPRDMRRAETAPMVLTMMAADGSVCVGGLGEEAAPGEEYRYTEEYHSLYYSKTPRDPRMLPPLTRRRPAAKDGAAPDDVRLLSMPASELISPPPLAPSSSALSSTVLPSSSLWAPKEDPKPAPSAADNAKAKLKLYIDTSRPEWDYPEIKGCVREFSRDQDGSRLVQRLIEKPKNLVFIFEEVLSDFEDLSMDVFGNYVLQRLFDAVPRAERQRPVDPAVAEAHMLDRLIRQVHGNLKKYAFQTYGCRVMQKALENMGDEDRDAIVHELDGCILESVLDQNANHVVQKIIEKCPEKCQFIVDAFLPHLTELACHVYGCRVLQCTFEKCNDVIGVKIRPLLEAVLQHISEFTIHQYGNYVVQHAMLNAPEDLRHRFVAQLTPQVYALSCSKFASNVAEKVVVTANNEERNAIIEFLTKPIGESQGGNYLVNMMHDTYANYVVQRFLEAASTSQRSRIGTVIMPYVGIINQSVYGRYLLRKMGSMGIFSNDFLLMRGIDINAPEYGGGHNPGNMSRNNASSGGNNGRNSRRNHSNNANDNRKVFNNHRLAHAASHNLTDSGGLGGTMHGVIPAPSIPGYTAQPFMTMPSYMPVGSYTHYMSGLPNPSAPPTLGYPAMYTAASPSNSQPQPQPQPPSQPQPQPQPSFFVSGTCGTTPPGPPPQPPMVPPSFGCSNISPNTSQSNFISGFSSPGNSNQGSPYYGVNRTPSSNRRRKNLHSSIRAMLGRGAVGSSGI